MKVKNQYPDWVEKYREKGKTIRKVRGGYGLYKCTSVYVPGAKHPKSTQEYLGMITEDKGFLPKKSTSDNPTYIEYGLSHLIWKNFKRALIRSSFNGDEYVVRLGIIMYLFGRVDESVIPLSFISDSCEDVLTERLTSTDIKRIERLSSKVGKLLQEKIRDDSDRFLLESSLRNCVMDSKNRSAQIPSLPAPALQLIERYTLKYGDG